MGRGLWSWFRGRGEGGRSLDGIVGRLRQTVGIPEVSRRQVCGERSAVDEVGGCLVRRKAVWAKRERERLQFCGGRIVGWSSGRI